MCAVCVYVAKLPKTKFPAGLFSTVTCFKYPIPRPEHEPTPDNGLSSAEHVVTIWQDDNVPLVRSVACAEASPESSLRCVEGKEYCVQCGNLVQRVVWWAEKITLAARAQATALGEKADTHKTYEEMYEELARSVGSIPDHCENGACRQFVQMRFRALPKNLFPEDCCRHVL